MMSSLSIINNSFEKFVSPEQETVLEGFFKLATNLVDWRQANLYLYDHAGQLLIPFLEYNNRQNEITRLDRLYYLPLNTGFVNHIVGEKHFSDADNSANAGYIAKNGNGTEVSLPIRVNGRLLALFKAVEPGDNGLVGHRIPRRQVLEMLVEQLTVNLAITRQLNTVLNAAWIDPITRLPNRLFLEKRLETDLAYALHRRANVALVIIQIQNLVSFCGTLPDDENYEGLPLVDFIPYHLAQLIKPALKETDVCVRFDTNSFALLLLQHHEVEAYRLSLKLCQLIQEDSFLKKLEDSPLEIRFGISSYPYLAGDMTTLLNQTTMALQAGRKEPRIITNPLVRIWKASPAAKPEQLAAIEDLEVCRAILQGFNYYPLQKNSYRRLDGSIIPLQFAQQNQCLPVKRQRDVLTVAMVNPVNQELIAQVARMTGYHVLPVVTTRMEIEAAFTYLKRTALPKIQNSPQVVPWNN